MFKIFPDVETMIISIGLILILMWGVSRCNDKQRELSGKAAQIGLESRPRVRAIDTISMSAVDAAVAAATASTPKPVPPKTPAQVLGGGGQDGEISSFINSKSIVELNFLDFVFLSTLIARKPLHCRSKLFYIFLLILWISLITRT